MNGFSELTYSFRRQFQTKLVHIAYHSSSLARLTSKWRFIYLLKMIQLKCRHLKSNFHPLIRSAIVIIQSIIYDEKLSQPQTITLPQGDKQKFPSNMFIIKTKEYKKEQLCTFSECVFPLILMMVSCFVWKMMKNLLRNLKA